MQAEKDQKNQNLKQYAPLVISGCSGVGKGTLIKYLLNNFDIFELSISLTTRKPRQGEAHGREYFFVQKQQFQAEIDNKSFAEYCEVHGNFYGTHKAKLNDIISRGKICVLDIDLQGAQKIKKHFEKECNYLFIDAPSLQELEKRLRGRKTDTEESIQKRLKNAIGELETVSKLNYYEHLVNAELNQSYGKLKEYVLKHYEIKM